MLAEENVMLVCQKEKNPLVDGEYGRKNSHRDEARFMRNFSITYTKQGERSAIYMGGFSLGGALVNISRVLGALTTGVHPICLGSSQSCTSGFDVRHVHGLSDTTWPFEGEELEVPKHVRRYTGIIDVIIL